MVIAILAAISIVAFTGIKERAQFTRISTIHKQAQRQALATGSALSTLAVDAQLKECSGSTATMGYGNVAVVDAAIWAPTKDPGGGCGFYFPEDAYYGDVPERARQVDIFNNLPKDIHTMRVGFLFKHSEPNGGKCKTNSGGSIVSIMYGIRKSAGFAISNSCHIRVSTSNSPVDLNSGGSSWIDSEPIVSGRWYSALIEVSNRTHVKIYLDGELVKGDDLPYPLAVATNYSATLSYGGYSDNFRGTVSSFFVNIN